MGIYSRDYSRDDDEYSPRTWSTNSPACQWVIIVTVAVFLLQNAIIADVATDAGPTAVRNLRYSVVERWFVLDPNAVKHGEVWRLLTYAFCHTEPLGLALNMVVLWIFGSRTEGMRGSREWLAFYLCGAIAGGLGHLLFSLVVPTAVPVMGATGPVLAVLTLYALYYPREQLWLFGLFPIECRWLVVGYLVMDLWPLLLALSFRSPQFEVGHLSHAASVMGIAWAWIYLRGRLIVGGLLPIWSVGGLLRSWRDLRRRRTLQVYADDADDDFAGTNNADRLDTILAKIHSQGSDSLTPQERDFLARESERAKRRQAQPDGEPQN